VRPIALTDCGGMCNVSYNLQKGRLGVNIRGMNQTQHGEGVGDLKTISSVKGVVSALLIAANVLAFATGVQSQSAADVQKAIGILTDTSNSLQEDRGSVHSTMAQ
jgi:hypothetical protein